MTRVGFSPKPGISEAEAVTIADVQAVLMASNAEAALILQHPELAVALAATICDNNGLTAVKAALAFNEAGLTATRAAAILNHANLTAAKAASIFDHANLTAAKAASIFNEAGLAAQKAADIFDHANLSTAKAVSIASHANLTAARYNAIIVLMADPSKLYFDATLARFQDIAAAGTFSTNPDDINDNNVGSFALADTINQYSEVDFAKWVKIDQWRIHGGNNNNNDGSWKIEYYGTDLAWHDWVTGIVTNDGVWTAMAFPTEATCKKIRLTCTAVDSGISDSACGELEVYHT